MFRNLFGRGDRAGGPFYRPYRKVEVDKIYNLLFCDDPVLFRGDGLGDGPIAAVLSDTADRETLERIANDLDIESRVRALAFNRLREMKVSVPLRRLLGTIIEVPFPDGLDVLAVFSDGRLRYINQSGKLAIFEDTPPTLREKAEELLRVSQIVVNQIGPWDKPRPPPPKAGRMRMTFLVSDGLYFGEGADSVFMKDRLAAPVLMAGVQLVRLVVDTALEAQQRR